jgi:hypothetical protein
MLTCLSAGGLRHRIPAHTALTASPPPRPLQRLAHARTHARSFGAPTPTQVSLDPVPGKAILMTGACVGGGAPSFHTHTQP